MIAYAAKADLVLIGFLALIGGGVLGWISFGRHH